MPFASDALPAEKEQWEEGAMKFDEKSLSVLPREVPHYDERQAAHLRPLAANATTGK